MLFDTPKVILDWLRRIDSIETAPLARVRHALRQEVCRESDSTVETFWEKGVSGRELHYIRRPELDWGVEFEGPGI